MTAGPPSTAQLTSVPYVTYVASQPAPAYYSDQTHQQVAAATPNYQQLSSAVQSSILVSNAYMTLILAYLKPLLILEK